MLIPISISNTCQAYPRPLPAGERILWQGKPLWRTLAIRAFHCRKVAIYFGLVLAVVLISGWNEGATRMELVDDALITLFLCALALAILGTLAWLSAKVTIYTLTNKRILIRFGIALQVTINLPFTQIASANVRENSDGTGDIPLVLTDSTNVNYLVLWPHVRPWHLASPQPMLRAVPHVHRLATLISEVVQQPPPGVTSPDTASEDASDKVSTDTSNAVDASNQARQSPRSSTGPAHGPVSLEAG